MKVKMILFLFIVLQISCTSDLGKEKVYNYLKENYELESNKITSFAKRSYYIRGQRPVLQNLNLENIALKTGYNFYKTVLTNTLSVAPRSIVIIALPKTETDQVFELRSIGRNEIYTQFIPIFNGIKIPEQAEKKILVNEISTLFSNLTKNGKIKHLKGSDNQFSTEFWINNQLYRTLIFIFKKDELKEIRFFNPD